MELREMLGETSKTIEGTPADAVGPTTFRVDVVIPSLRCKMASLERIVSVRVPKEFKDLSFYVVVDSPRIHLGHFASLIEKYPRTKIVIRKDISLPSGASAARNAGLERSNADWVVLLDDDVVPDRDVLFRYYEALTCWKAVDRGVGQIGGFAGATIFNIPPTIFGLGVKCQGMLSPFTYCARDDSPAWTPTSNVMIRRLFSENTAWRFDESLPRNGGSEDVELCARMFRKNVRLFSVPSAIVQHDLWSTRGTWSRALRWGSSSVDLCVRHPNHVRCSFPDTIEMMLTIMAVWIATAAVLWTTRPRTFDIGSWSVLGIVTITSLVLLEMLTWIARLLNDLTRAPRPIHEEERQRLQSSLHNARFVSTVTPEEVRRISGNSNVVFTLCVLAIGTCAAIIDLAFGLGRVYGYITKEGCRGILTKYSRSFDYNFGKHEKLPLAMALRKSFVRVLLIPTALYIIGVVCFS